MGGAGKREMAAEGGDCSMVQEKCYAVAAKWWLVNCEVVETPPGSCTSAQMRGERTKEPLAVGSS